MAATGLWACSQELDHYETLVLFVIYFVLKMSENIGFYIKTRCTRGDARSFFCTYKTYLYAQNYFRKNKFKYCFKSYIKLHEYANCNSANYDV